MGPQALARHAAVSLAVFALLPDAASAQPCMGDQDCDDGNVCTRDVCSAGTCTFPPEPDTDADGICDPADNCPFRFNPGQEDFGDVGFFDPNGRPDGIGDVCQCGDLTGNAFVDFFDIVAMRFLQVEAITLYQDDLERCSVIGGPDDCNMADAVVIARAVVMPPLPPGVSQVCRAAVGP